MTIQLTRPAPPPAPPATGRPAGQRLAGHRLFGAVLAAAAALRVVAMLGYRPGFLYYGDSYAYLDSALRMRPNWGFQPSGYGLLLRALQPLHSLATVVAVQHVMGLAVGVMIYALLRLRFGLPGWGATLAAVPPLFDAYLLQLEAGILSDTLFIFLVTSAITVVLWKATPRHAAAAGLLLALAALTRTIGLPLLALLLGHLLVRRADWRAVAAALIAAALPLMLYSGWYAAHYGRFTLATGDGIALWARTATFADCAAFRPDDPRLCPDGLRLDAASEYVWAADSQVNRYPGGYAAGNGPARHFALQAIAAQPTGYVAAVGHDVSLAFHWDRAAHPRRVLPAYEFPVTDVPLRDEPGARRIVRGYDPGTRSVRAVQPYAGLLRGYQDIARVPGPLLAELLLVGALCLRRRETVLPWAAAGALLVLPVAVLDFDHRYVLPVIPPACLAVALAIAPRERRRDIQAPAAGHPDTLESCPRRAGTS